LLAGRQAGDERQCAATVLADALVADNHLVAVDAALRFDPARLDLLVAPEPTRLTVTHPEHRQRTVSLPAGVYAIHTLPGPPTATIRPFWRSRFSHRQ
jgi:hypothetical protein